MILRKHAKYSKFYFGKNPPELLFKTVEKKTVFRTSHKLGPEQQIFILITRLNLDPTAGVLSDQIYLIVSVIFSISDVKLPTFNFR